MPGFMVLDRKQKTRFDVDDRRQLGTLGGAGPFAVDHPPLESFVGQRTVRDRRLEDANVRREKIAVQRARHREEEEREIIQARGIFEVIVGRPRRKGDRMYRSRNSAKWKRRPRFTAVVAVLGSRQFPSSASPRAYSPSTAMINF